MTTPVLPHLSDRPRFGLLAGVRVLDLTSSLAGPYATLLLADMGAEVAKIERPGVGDDARQWGPPFLDGLSLWYASVNRNKASVTLDYAALDGKAVLDRMVAQVDVVVTNLRPSVQEKLGVDHSSLQAIRPDLIHCSITGFGLTGRRRDLASYDLIAEGYSGVMDLTGEPESPPQKVGTPAADLLAGMDGAFAVVAALFDRQRTGRGHVVDVSLVESMTRFLSPRIVPYLGSGEVPHRSGGRDSVIAVYQAFDTADHPITLGLANDRTFSRFCQVAGRTEWLDDPAYADNRARRERRPELVARIQEVLRTRTRAEWLEAFAAAGVPAGPINTVADVAVDDGLLERGLLFSLPVEGGSPVPQVGTGWLLDGAPNGGASPPRPLGADGDEVLHRWAGLAPGEIGDLRRAGVV
jgi:crotonobetainyl-CoA:carnitine CoA-transferase CaiB-like acyl-CoA transferase